MFVTQSCPALCDPTDYSFPGCSVYEIVQARILEWVAIPFTRDLPNARIESRCPALQVDSWLLEPPGKPPNFYLRNPDSRDEPALCKWHTWACQEERASGKGRRENFSRTGPQWGKGRFLRRQDWGGVYCQGHEVPTLHFLNPVSVSLNAVFLKQALLASHKSCPWMGEDTQRDKYVEGGFRKACFSHSVGISIHPCFAPDFTENVSSH